MLEAKSTQLRLKNLLRVPNEKDKVLPYKSRLIKL